jgi:hypothetical protein
MEGLSQGAIPSTHRQLPQRTAQERPENTDQQGRVRSGDHQKRRRMPNDMLRIIRANRAGVTAALWRVIANLWPIQARRSVDSHR